MPMELDLIMLRERKLLYPTPRPLACLVYPVALYSTGQSVVPGHVMTEALHVIVSGKI